MDTRESTSRRAVRRILLAGAALALSATLLALWLSGLAWASPSADVASAQAAAPMAFDLSINKTTSPEVFIKGGSHRYIITVSRVNDDPISSVVFVSDTLPNGLTWTPANINNWQCLDDSTPTLVKCFYNKIPQPNESFDLLQFFVTVPSNITVPQVVNTAKLYDVNGYSDADSTNNSSTITTTILASGAAPQLSITKQIDDPSPNPNYYVGQTLRFILSVTNTGSAAATNVQIRDTLDAALTYDSCLPVGSCTYNSTTRVVQSTISTLAAGATATRTIIARVNNTVTQVNQISNFANAIYGTPTITNTSNTVQLTVLPATDLRVTKTDNRTFVQAGQNTEYTITISNIGSLDANGVFITDTLITPSLMSWVSVDTSNTSLTNVLSETNRAAWLLNETLSPGEQVSFKITVKVAGDAQSPSTIINQISVGSSTTPEYALENNTVQDINQILAIDTSLSLSKSVSPSSPSDPLSVGELVTFTLKARNNSLPSASFVNVTDALNSALNFVSCSITPQTAGYCSYNSSARTVQTIIYELPLATEIDIKIVSRVNDTVISPRTGTNTAYISWGSNTRPSDTVQMYFSPAADLHAKKTDGVSEVLPGDVVTYTVSVTNTGSLAAVGVVIVDNLGANLSMVRLILPEELDTATIITTTSSIQISLPTPMDPGDLVSFRLVAKVSASAPIDSNVINTVQATTFTPEGNTVNNTAVDSNKVVSRPSVSIDLTVNRTQVDPGDPIAFSIAVRNNSSATVANAKVVDDFSSLSSVLELTGGETDRGSITISGNVVTANLGAIPPGQGANILIKANVKTTAAKNTYSHTAVLTYDPNFRVTDSVSFRVKQGGVLPGTGQHPVEADIQVVETVPSTHLTLPFLIVLGVGLLAGIMLWLRRAHRSWPRWLGGLGVLLILSIVTLGCGVFGAPATPPEPDQSQATLQSISHAEPSPTPAQAGPPGQAGQPEPTRRPTATPTALPPLLAEIVDLFPTPTPDSLPEFSIPTPSFRPTLGPNGIPPDDSAVTRIVIPATGLDTVVKYVPFSGDTWLIGGLKWEIAWMGDTSWPGLGGNTGLAGHVDFADGSPGPFGNLSQLRPGHEIILYTQRNIFVYQVRTQATVDDTDLSVIDPTDNAQITLITCTGWDSSVRLYLKRLIVFADLVEVRPLN